LRGVCLRRATECDGAGTEGADEREQGDLKDDHGDQQLDQAEPGLGRGVLIGRHRCHQVESSSTL
jgi:hypothetical protein